MSEVKYDNLKVTMEPKETPEAHLLLVHIPEGFQRHNIGAKIEFDYGRVRVFGELPPENNVIKRFNQGYQVPETCDINSIKGKFEGRIVTITMRKKKISEVPDQKPQPVPAQEVPKTPVQETKPEPEQDNKDHDDTPPQPQPQSEPGECKRQEPHTDEEEDQKGQKGQYQEEEPTSDKEEDQKGQEGLSKPDSKSTTEYKEEADSKTPTKPEDKEESKPEIMDQKGVTQEATSKDAQRDEKSTGKTTDEKEEKPREEETKEEIDGEKAFEREKQPDEETLVDDSPSIVSNKKRKASSAFVSYYVPESIAKRMTTIIEDKQKLIYMGAAFAVVALGVYVSYKLRSSARH